jgi:hypothetical protein
MPSTWSPACHRGASYRGSATKAIEQLGSGRLDVRIGGIYAVERTAHDSLRDHLAVLEVLAAFIREQRSRAVATERARRGDAGAGNAPRCTGCGRRNWSPNPQARPGGEPCPRESRGREPHPREPYRRALALGCGSSQGLATDTDSGRWKQADTNAGGAATHLLRLDRAAFTCRRGYARAPARGMAWRAAGSAPRPERGRSARAVVSARPPGSPAPWQDTTRCPGPRVRAASAGVHSHGIHDTITRPRPHSWPFAHSSRQHHQAGRRTSTTRWKHLSNQDASVPFCLAWIDRAGPARRAAQVSAQDVDKGLPPHGGRRARLGIISGCPQIVPVSPRCPTAKRPARWHQSPLQLLVKQRSRNPRSRSRHGPNRWNRRQCRHRCPRQCRRHRRRNPGRSRGPCRRRNRTRTRSQYRTQSRTRRRCRRRCGQRPTRSAATSSPGGADPSTRPAPVSATHGRCPIMCHHDGALILPVGD